MRQNLARLRKKQKQDAVITFISRENLEVAKRSFYFTLRCDRIQQPSYFYQIKEILSDFSRETKDLVLNKLVNKLYLFDGYIFLYISVLHSFLSF